MRFDLVDLSLFCHVAEAGSITAPNRVHLALAAASTRIRHMEETLGAPQLVRGRQGVTPTQAGRTLLRSQGWQEREAFAAAPICGQHRGPQLVDIRSL